MACLDDDQVHRFVSGQLGELERIVVETELARCGPCASLVAAVARRDQPDERYELGEVFARGGMGTVLRAHDRRLHRAIAVKRLDATDEDARARFEREIAVTASLQHPNIVPIYDAGLLDDGRPFYAMRHVPGSSLEVVIARATSTDERLALLVPIIDAANAVAYAHEQGVVHRDLKPLNILVGPFGETVVIDWGLARLGSNELAASTVDGEADVAATRDGTILGTPRYMAPEQARGERASEASDVYALGAILHHALAGAPAIDDIEVTAAVDRVGAGRAARLGEVAPELPRDLIAIVERATATEPEDRYASAGELAADLRRFQDGRMVTAYRYSRQDRVTRFVRRHRIAVTVAAIAAIAVIAIGVTSVVSIVHERDAAEDASTVAESQRLRAEAQREGAEGLVNFMLSDLRQSLAAIGRADVLDGVAARIGTYLDRTHSQTGSEPAVLRSRARVLEIRALAASRTGDSAADAYRSQAFALLDQADVAGAPVASLELRASLWNGRARAQASRGDADAAIASYRNMIELSHRLAATGSMPAELNIVAAYTAMADLELKRDHMADAEHDYDAAGEALERARAGHVDAALVASRRAMLGVARTLAQIGRENLDAATTTVEAVIADVEPRATGNLASNELRRLAWMALTLRAQIQTWRGDDTAAGQIHERARAIAEAAVRVEPSDPIRQSELATSEAGIAEAALARGDTTAARNYIDAAVARIERDLAQHPTEKSLVDASFGIAQSEARVFRTLSPRRALAALGRAIAGIDHADPAHAPRTSLAMAHAHAAASLAALAVHDLPRAHANVRQAVALVEAVPAGHDTAVMMFDRAAALTAIAVAEGPLDRVRDARTHGALAHQVIAELAARVRIRTSWQRELESLR